LLTNGDTIAFAHNGNLPSVAALQAFLRSKGRAVDDDVSDSKLMVEAIGVYVEEGMTLPDAIQHAYPLFTGAFSAVAMSKDVLVAFRDACGIRPLSLAKLNGGYVVASETCAFHTIGATYIRDVEPGEMVVISQDGLKSIRIAPARPAFDIFEFIYFSRSDSELVGRSVYEVRKSFGRNLAREFPLALDVVIPVPETAVPIALGYAAESGVPFEMGLAKNRYIHRTFIQPEQRLREQGVKLKLAPIRETIAGKRVAVIDDSIVRGTTSRQIVQLMWEAGATEVHFLVSSPPIKYPDFYGIDISKQSELLAATKSVEEMRDYLGATSLGFLSLDGVIHAIGLPKDQLCTSCFTGEYPIDIKERRSEFSHQTT
jgi:amidophosphoribosyltransferase